MVRRLCRLLSALCCLCLSHGVVRAGDIVAENKLARFRFDAGAGHALVEVLNKTTGRSVRLDPSLAVGRPGLWRLEMLSDDGADAPPVFPTGPAKVTRQKTANGQAWTLVWTSIAAGNDQVSVTVHLSLPNDSPLMDMRMAAKVRGRPAAWIQAAEFPRLAGIQPLGDDCLVYGFQEGRMRRDPARRLGNSINLYHPGTWSIQMAAFFGSEQLAANGLAEFDNKQRAVNGFRRGPADDETGLLVAVDDPAYHHKTFDIVPRGGRGFTMSGTNYPAWPAWPRDAKAPAPAFDYELPYSYKIGTFAGGIDAAADLYRGLAAGHPSFARGPLRNPDGTPNHVSARLLDNVFWCKFYYPSNKLVPEALAMREYLGVPTAVHWYRYYTNFFDDNNLDYFPTAPFFREGVSALKAMGVAVAPYVCCTLWMPTAESYRLKGMAEAVLMDKHGPYDWQLQVRPGVLKSNYWMHPAAPRWHDEYRSLTRRLFGQVGTNAQYLDVLGTVTRRAYNPELGTIHGGDYWARGQHKLLDALREDVLALEPDAFLLAEGFSEDLVGRADSYYNLNLVRDRDAFPLLQLVYHDYTTTYGSSTRQHGGITTPYYRHQMGLQFVGGQQLTLASYNPTRPGGEHRDKDEFTRELARAWRQAANKFLNGGRGLSAAQIPDRALAGTAGVALVSPEYAMDLQEPNGAWRGPSVFASAWRAHDGTLGVTLANISGADQPVELLLRPKTLNAAGRVLWRSWPGPVERVGQLDGPEFSHAWSLPADGAAVFEIRDDTPPTIGDLLPDTRRYVVFDKARQGEFPTVDGDKGVLYQALDAILDNDFAGSGNRMTPVSRRTHRRLRNSAHGTRWEERDGLGGPRDPDDVGFQIIEPGPWRVEGDGAARIDGAGGVATARLEMKTPGRLLPEPGTVLFRRAAPGVFHATAEPLPLAEGVTLAAALPAELTGGIPEGDDIAAWLGAFSRKAADEARALLGPSSIVSNATRDRAEQWLRAGNAAAYLLTAGGTSTSRIRHEWLMPHRPQEIVFARRDFNAQADDDRLEVLAADLAPAIAIRREEENRYTATVLRRDAAANFAALLHTTEFSAPGGAAGVMTRLAWMEIAEPLLTEINPKQLVAPYTAASRQVRLDLRIVNASSEDLPITVDAELPEGWRLDPEENRLAFTLEALKHVEMPVTIVTDGNASGTRKAKLIVNYTGNPETRREMDSTLEEIAGDLAPVDPTAKPEPTWSNTRRHGSMSAVLVGDDRRIRMEVKDGQFGTTRSFTVRVLDAGLNELSKAEHRLEKDQVASLDMEVPAPGAYFLRFDHAFARYRFLNIAHHGFFARPGNTYHFNGQQDGDHTTLYFYVKPGARSFQFAGADGGPSEPGGFRFFSPDGQKRFDRYGAWSPDNWFTIEVPAGSDGKIWKVEVRALDDLDLMLRGDGVEPLLSLTPGGVLRDLRREKPEARRDGPAANRSGHPETRREMDFTLEEIACDLAGVNPAAKPEPLWSNALPRGSMSAIRVGGDRRIRMDVRLTELTSSFTLRVLDAGLRELSRVDHALDADQRKERENTVPLDLEVPAPGVYFLQFDHKFARYRFANIAHHGFFARPGNVYHFNGNGNYHENNVMTMYFYVKPGARTFQFAGIDSGPLHPASVRIFSPGGDKCFDRFGAWSPDSWFTVKAPPAAGGGIWKVEVRPSYYMGFMLRGAGVEPLLSLTPGAVLRAL